MDQEYPRKKLTKAEKKAKYRTDYAEPIKSRREVLKQVMVCPESEREEKARALHKLYLKEDYRSGANVYGMAVDMIKAMPDRGKIGGQTLADWYLSDFGEWLDSTGIEEELREKHLTCEIQLGALKNCNANQKLLVGKIFNIAEEQLQKEIKECADAAILKNEFATAAELALNHNLKYTFDELALPLILTNKAETAYSLMAGNKAMFEKLLWFLDQFIGLTEFDVEKILDPYRRSHKMTIPNDRFINKAVDTFIKGVISKATNEPNKFKIALDEFAPKYARASNEKGVKYTITARFDKENGSDPVYFQDMCDWFSENTPEQWERILFGLFDSKRSVERQIDAISWALYLNLQDHTGHALPGVMKDFFRAPDYRLKEAEKLLAKRKELRTPKPGEKLFVFEDKQQYPIQLVADDSKLEQLCSNLKFLEDDEDPVYVGFDSEWRPTHTANSETKIALIQLFFRDQVWLVDTVSLERQEPKVREETWQKFGSRLLKSKKIKVIGFDLKNDLDAFLTIPALSHIMRIDEIRNTWCLKRLTENVCEIDMNILGLPKKTFKLADLTDKLLGLKLDKSEQCSNWQSRPLRKNQIVYAAMDAVVVVELFKKVLELTEEKYPMRDIGKLMDESNVMAPKKERSLKEKRKLKTIPWEEIYEALRDCGDPSKRLKRPYDIKVIVDTMLNGFGKSLRRVGIDTYIPESVSEFTVQLQHMNRVGGDLQRQIITVPSKSYLSLKANYGDHTYAIPELNNMSDINQIITFFELYNIDIRPEDVMLRCMACNSRLLVKFPGPVLNFLHQYNVIHTQNVFRAHMNDFPLEEWWEKMLNIDPRDYEGVRVDMSRPTRKSNWIVATVPTGCLHITRNTVIHNNLPEGVEVLIHKVPDDEFKRPNVCFYVCGDCGTVSYDGHDS